MPRKPKPLDLDDPSKRQGTLVVRHKFDDGTEGIIGLNNAIGLEVKAARRAGEHFGKEAKVAERTNQARAAAKKGRPGRSDPLRGKIIELMGDYRHNEFKTFLAAWEMDVLHGLRLTLDRNSRDNKGAYCIHDENQDLEPKRYTIGTLAKMFSQLE